jgi:hypothetical protein
MALDAFKQFFTNETVRDQAWEATKSAVNYGVDNYAPSAKALFYTAAAVVVGGVAIGGGIAAHRRGHLARITPDANTFTKKRWVGEPARNASTHTDSKHNAGSSLTGGGESSHGASSSAQDDDVAHHTRSHDKDGESERRSRSPSPTRRNTDQ